ncbi:phenylalanine--tRNA ligase subunit beta [Candidatus Woesearchaeota archaeon]|nr:phenylalanine--tRNA ligase subunit beta [Candidatus Woesearchaeota archaeon]
MPTVTLNRQVVEKLVGKRLSPEQWKDRISMLGTDLERIDEKEIVVEIFPNRPDMLSEQGFARALATFVGSRRGLKEHSTKKSGQKVIIEKSVETVRPYTVTAIVKNLHFTDERIKEVIQIQEKLHITYGRRRRKCAIGIYPLEKISFPITYRAKRPEDIHFIPLGFQEKLSAKQILEQHPAGKEYGSLLNQQPLYPIFQDAKGEILSMPPIINSQCVGQVTEETREVFIECSGFDFAVLEKCLHILVTALADMGGELYSMELQYPQEEKSTPHLQPTPMKLDVAYVNRILGLSLQEKEVQHCLEQMGYGYREGSVLIPAYRADILHPIDLVEDIAIAYGFERFHEEIPKVSTIGAELPFERFKRKIAELLLGLGFLELNTYHLIPRELQTTKMCLQGNPVVILDPVSTEYNTLRMSMLPSLLQVLQWNKTREFPQKLYDVGVVFTKEADTETGVKETVMLGVAVSHSKAGFTEMKQVMEYFFQILHLSYVLADTEETGFIQGRVGKVSAGGREMAVLGEVHPQVLEQFGLEMPVVVMEINVESIFALLEEQGIRD